MRKSESNMEHYRGEILNLVKDGYPLAKVNGKPVNCNNVSCGKCEFYPADSCNASTILWLMEDYEPEITLTAREKHFVEFAETGWVTKDADGFLEWNEEKPEKDLEMKEWYSHGLNHLFGMSLFGDCFPFITWEDEEPWEVESLRKLKVKEGDQDA